MLQYMRRFHYFASVDLLLTSTSTGTLPGITKNVVTGTVHYLVVRYEKYYS